MPVPAFHHPPLSTLLPLSWLHGRRIGLLGGSFNPPHEGHRHIAEEALKRLRLHEVWWLPALHNPLKPADIYADFDQRLAQARHLANHPRFRVLDIERCLGARYTIELLTFLTPLLAQAHCVWIMGADSFASLHRWKRWRAIASMMPLAVFDRPHATLSALCAPAARALRHARLPASMAARLPNIGAPAWTFISIPRHPQSSTQLRRQATAIHHQAKNLASRPRNGA